MYCVFISPCTHFYRYPDTYRVWVRPDTYQEVSESFALKKKKIHFRYGPIHPDTLIRPRKKSSPKQNATVPSPTTQPIGKYALTLLLAPALRCVSLLTPVRPCASTAPPSSLRLPATSCRQPSALLPPRPLLRTPSSASSGRRRRSSAHPPLHPAAGGAPSSPAVGACSFPSTPSSQDTMIH